MKHPINPRLLEDLSERLGVQDLFQWIEAEAECLGKLGRGRNNVVYFSSQLIRARNVAQVIYKTTVGSACIVPKNGRYLIYVNRLLPPLPKRFAIAHEIGHTYWFAPGGEARPLSPLQWTLGRDPSIEVLCNRFAAALLLPRSLLVTSLKLTEGTGAVMPCLADIPKIARAHWVAEQLVARRLFFEMLPSRMAIICLRRDGGQASKTEKAPVGSWLISWAALPGDPRKAANQEGGVIVAKAPSRRVPSEMLPIEAPDRCGKVKLDSRFWDMIRVVSPSQARVSLKRWARGSDKVGYFSMVDDRAYLGLPLPVETDSCT
jgi:Zn-dependent peptidase ImmA (M78 family)